MTEIQVEIDLANPYDLAGVELGVDSAVNVRRARIPAIVDASAMMLALPEETVAALGLQGEIADWRHSGFQVANAVMIQAGGRSMATNCLVLPVGERAVVGQTVMRVMDLVVDEESRSLVPHPESRNGPRIRL